MSDYLGSRVFDLERRERELTNDVAVLHTRIATFEVATSENLRRLADDFADLLARVDLVHAEALRELTKQARGARTE